MGKVDSLTGLMNRNSYHMAIDGLLNADLSSLGCIYIDVNGLHELNNHLGHLAGDKMLITVADVLKHNFPQSGIYRIGGDEFVLLIQDGDRKDILSRAELCRRDLEEHNYGLSIGIEWRDRDFDISAIILAAETAMQQDKEQYYRNNGKERQMRTLDQKLEEMIVAKQDADTFLSVLAPEFMGVYFVDLSSDTIRHLFIPSYFEEILQEAVDKFSNALMLYAKRIAMPEYLYQFELFCEYENLEKQLNENTAPEFTYQRLDGTWLNLKVLKFKNYNSECRETLWIFANTDTPMAK